MTRPAKVARLVVVLALCLLIPACKNKVTKANYEKLKDGMTLAEVEKFLGKGTKEEGDGSNVAAQFGVAIQNAPTSGGGETYTWEQGGNTITITFRDGKVVSKRTSGF